jgi:hypothetical protein
LLQHLPAQCFKRLAEILQPCLSSLVLFSHETLDFRVNHLTSLGTDLAIVFDRPFVYCIAGARPISSLRLWVWVCLPIISRALNLLLLLASSCSLGPFQSHVSHHDPGLMGASLQLAPESFAQTEFFADTHSINWILLFVMVQNISTLLSDIWFFLLTLEGVRLSLLPIRTWGIGLLYHGE